MNPVATISDVKESTGLHWAPRQSKTLRVADIDTVQAA